MLVCNKAVELDGMFIYSLVSITSENELFIGCLETVASNETTTIS